MRCGVKLATMEYLDELNSENPDVIVVGISDSSFSISGYYSGVFRFYRFDMSLPLWSITERYQHKTTVIMEGTEKEVKPHIKFFMPDNFSKNKVRDALIKEFPFLAD